MSADNGIYIHKFDDGWAVIHTQAIENIYWHKGDAPYNYKILNEYFEGAPRFKTQPEALSYAWKLAKEYPMLEYGISEV